MILVIFLIAAGAYLFGSFPTGYLLVRIFRHEDIRQSGSGNIGTNPGSWWYVVAGTG